MELCNNNPFPAFSARLVKSCLTVYKHWSITYLLSFFIHFIQSCKLQFLWWWVCVITEGWVWAALVEVEGRRILMRCWNGCLSLRVPDQKIVVKGLQGNCFWIAIKGPWGKCARLRGSAPLSILWAVPVIAAQIRLRVWSLLASVPVLALVDGVVVVDARLFLNHLRPGATTCHCAGGGKVSNVYRTRWRWQKMCKIWA